MAEYRIRETGSIVTEHEFRQMYPNTSFPIVLTEEIANDFGMDVVFDGPTPQITHLQVYYRDGVKQIDGKWYTKYAVADMEQDAIDSTLRLQWDGIRDERNRLLLESDWTQLDDCPLTNTQRQQWAMYRQALRDITLQQDPFNIVWPQKP